MARYLIALGSSHIQGYKYIQDVLSIIKKSEWLSFCAASHIYRNNSLGSMYNRLFYNNVCALYTNLHPQVFYRELMRIEQNLGRIRTYKFAPRTIDIDVLISLEFEFISSNFILPHREILNRKFFVIPAIEALKLANWPMPFRVLKASRKFGQGYLYPIPL